MSARKIPSNLPRSASRAKSCQYSIVLYAVERSRGCVHIPCWIWPMQFMSKALRRISFGIASLSGLGRGQPELCYSTNCKTSPSEERPIRAQIEYRIAGPTVDVAAPQKVRDDEDVVGLPIERLAGDLGRAGAVERDIEAVGGLALPLRRFARTQQLGRIVEGREHRGPGRRVDEAKVDPVIGIAGLLAHRVERGADLGPAVMKHRRGAAADAAGMRDKARQ